jgi:enoyl-CoA hydratase
MTEEFENIRFETEDKVATITIDRPEKKNAIDVNTMFELQKAIQQIERRKEILALILTATAMNHLFQEEI